MSRAEAARIKRDPAQVKALLAAIGAQDQPVNFDRSNAPGVGLLRRFHPAQIDNSDDRLCVPLRARGELLALLVLADRVAGYPWTVQDLELLKALSDQVAASLLNLELAQKLAQAKQLEAFQVMSAFFVHDMKNIASTLSLMLQNLPVHFQDPEFRADAMTGIGDTVSHINHLISRLRLLRQQLAAKPVEADLNDLVSQALTALAPATRGELVRILKPVARVRVDPEQIRSVVANLVLNASDSLGAAGQIRIETAQSDGWVVLAVTDNGCGMTPEYLERLLFQPFETTKQHGIGIGMFQCKLIVEAHRGKIEVESQPGLGTVVRVLLPAIP